MTTPTSTPTSAPAAGRRRGGATAIVVATAVAGGIALAAVGISSAVHAFAPESPDPYDSEMNGGFSGTMDDFGELYEADLEGLEGLQIDAAAASFTLEFGDVEEAVLTVSNTAFAGAWSLYRDDADLVVEHPDLSLGGVTEGCLFGCSANAGSSGDVVLTLPQRFADTGRLSADISLAGGELRGEGAFDELDLEVNAGSLDLTGSARSLDLAVRVGEATVELADVNDAEIEVQTGEATVTLTGDAPQSVDATAKMGGLALQLPQEEYRVDLRGALGEVDNRLAENEKSKRLVRVQATAAEVTLR